MLKIVGKYRWWMFAFLCFVFVIWIVLGSPSFESCVNQTQNDAAKNHFQKIVANLLVYRGCVGPFLFANETTITAFSTIVIAMFTVILGIFTVSLARSTRIAADAANLSANAVVALELPIIRILPDVLTDGATKPIGGDIAFQHCSVHFVLCSNQGKNKAFPIELNYGFSLSLLPENPSYVFSENFAENEIFDANPTASHRTFLTQNYPLDFGAWSAICSGHIPVWFYCKLEYLDFMEKRHEAGFCWRWQSIGGGMGWRPDATPAYNQKT